MIDLLAVQGDNGVSRYGKRVLAAAGNVESTDFVHRFQRIDGLQGGDFFAGDGDAEVKRTSQAVVDDLGLGPGIEVAEVVKHILEMRIQQEKGVVTAEVGQGKIEGGFCKLIAGLIESAA